MKIDYKAKISIAIVCAILAFGVSLQFKSVRKNQGQGTISGLRASELQTLYQKEKEKNEALFNFSDEEAANDTSVIKETATGKVVVLKDVSSVADNIIVKVTGGTTETKVFAVGQNVWDEKYITVNSNAILASKNFIPVVSGEDYYFYCNSPILSVEEYGTPLFYNLTYYNSEKQQISVKAPTIVQRNSKITIPEGCQYIKFWVHEAYGQTYNNDICINVSDEKVNGTYVPYNKTEYNSGIYEKIAITTPIDSTITLFTEEDVTLECVYSKDIKKVFANDFTAKLGDIGTAIGLLRDIQSKILGVSE
jgi:hypothetical protein